MSILTNMPKYRCHKVVSALYIESIAFADVKSERFSDAEIESRANALYTAYCASVGNKAFNGDPLPSWTEFRADTAKKLQSDAWMNVAEVSLGTITMFGPATITPKEDGFKPFEVSAEFVAKHQPKAGGYFVVYEDGYQSFSPAKPFLTGYEKIHY